MPVSEDYDRYKTIPEIERKGDQVTFIHAHASKYTFKFEDGKKLAFSERGPCRDFFNRGIKEIRRCQSFFQEYRKGNISAEEKAAVQVVIQNDEDLIQTLENIKPCAIL